MIYLFDNKENLIKVMRSSALKSLIQTQSLTDEKYISDRVQVELKNLNDNVLNQVEYIAIPSIDDKYKYHLFFNAKTTSKSNNIFEGVQSGIEETRKTIIEDIRPNGQTAKSMADLVLKNTNWTTGYCDDVGTLDMNFYRTDVFSALKEICKSYNLEMQFFVEIHDNKIGARYIELRKEIGTKTGKRVVYGTNALEIVKEVEKTDLVTGLYGYGASLETDKGGYTRKIDFKDINGGLAYIVDATTTNIYGINTPSGMRAKFGIFEIDEKDPAILLKKTKEKLAISNRPLVTFKSSTIFIKGARIGDTVRVVRHDRHIDYETRIFEITWDRLSNRGTLKLGDKINVSENVKLEQLTTQIINKATPTMAEIAGWVVSADGGNKNYYTEVEPVNPKIGDKWFHQNPEHPGYTVIDRWNGEIWVRETDTYENALVKEAIEKNKANIETLNSEIATNKKLADDALAKANISGDLANTAKQQADTALNNANNALSQISATDGKLNTLTQTVDNQKAEISTKLTSAQVNQIVDSKGFATINYADTQIKASADGINATIQSVKGEQDSLKISVNDIKSTSEKNTATISQQGQSISQLAQTSETIQTTVRDLALRNILLDAKREVYSNAYNLIQLKLGFKPEVGKTYVFTAHLELGADRTAIALYNSGSSVSLGALSNKGNNIWQGKFTWRNSSTSNGVTYNADDTSIWVYQIPYTATSYSTFHWATLVEGDTAPLTYIEPSSEAVQSRVSQLAGSYAISVLGDKDKILSELNLTNGGVKIQGKLIRLDGEVTIDNAFIDNLLVNKMTASEVSAWTAKFGNVIAGNLDVNNISGNKSNFLQSSWNNMANSVKINGDGIFTQQNYQRAMEMSKNSLKVYDYNALGANLVGMVGCTAKDVNAYEMSIQNTDRGYLAFSHYNMATGGYGQYLVLDQFDKYNTWKPSGAQGYPIVFFSKIWFDNFINCRDIYARTTIDAVGEIRSGSNIKPTVAYDGRLIQGNAIATIPAESGINPATVFFYNYNSKQLVFNDGGQGASSYHFGYITPDSFSDIRLKENIKLTDYKALDLIDKIDFVQFDWKSDKKHEKLGLIANQLEELDKNLVKESGKDKIKTVKQYEMLMVLAKAIQELREEVKQWKQ